MPIATGEATILGVPLSSFLSFVVVAGLLTITPGLDTALVLRAAVGHGRAHAAATAAGILTGALSWGVIASVGAAAVLTASQTGYALLRWVGAGYLVWLGLRLLWQTFTDRSTHAAATTRSPPTAWRAWRLGLFTNLLNPKVGVFYVALLPQLLPHHNAVFWGVLLALVHDVEGALWFAAVIAGAHSLRRWLARRRVQRALDGVTGAALLGFGVRLATSIR